MALGPLLEGCKIPCPDRIPVIRLMLLQQPVADQKLDASLADFDRRNHGDAFSAALAQASGTGGGCRFMGHVTGCYYDINIEFCPTFGSDMNLVTRYLA